MRLNVYKHLKSMISTLYEVINYIEESDNKNQQFEVSKDCLIFIDKIIETIKESEASHRLLFSLEKVKEGINELKSSILNAEINKLEINNIIRELKKSENYFISDIKIEYKVVFFAELGEKWDSMESVYRAFKKRTNCKVDVVLTPIFRTINNNGEIKKEIIYIDYLADLGIKNVRYDDYELSLEKPDLAFISNPYEGVTLPQFWPENISKETRLVFLPYYTEMVINQETIKRNCMFPMANFSWRIIAQSNEIRELHEKYSLMKGENVLVTGLPKWDSAEKYKYNYSFLENTVSEEWGNKLKGKKVILWNSHYNIGTSTSTLLEYGEFIISIFKENKELGLIWRPHPMTETIIKLYMPDYLPLWEQLIWEVNNSSNMVIDTNKFLNEAFNCSSALLSDYSSIIPQYIFTQKPILFLSKPNADLDDSIKLINYDYLPKAMDTSGIKKFVFEIIGEIDNYKTERLNILERNYKNHNDNIGEKVVELLLSEICKEEFSA